MLKTYVKPADPLRVPLLYVYSKPAEPCGALNPAEPCGALRSLHGSITNALRRFGTTFYIYVYVRCNFYNVHKRSIALQLS